MKVDYIEHKGTDLSVVNAARVSFDKESDYCPISKQRGTEHWKLTAEDIKLINYLARENHWSPFSHPQVSIRVKAPIFVARQLAKHQVGFAWNEVSRRYVDTPPEFYRPTYIHPEYGELSGWRAKADNVKQGSSDTYHANMKLGWGLADSDAVYHRSHLKGCKTVGVQHRVDLVMQKAYALYMDMVEEGVCPEQARMILPQSMYTEWIWTGSLLGFSRVCKLRLDSHTQKETREVAAMIQDIVQPLFPVSWEALL